MSAEGARGWEAQKAAENAETNCQHDGVRLHRRVCLECLVKLYDAGQAAGVERCARAADAYALKYPVEVWPEENPGNLTRFQAIEWAGAKMARRTAHNIARELRGQP